MTESRESAIEELVLTRVMHMNALIVGIVCGSMLGLGIFAATAFLVLKGGEVVGPHLSLLGEYFIGYSVTVIGGLIGLLYGFVVGFVGGYFCCWLYNLVADFRVSRKLSRMSR